MTMQSNQVCSCQVSLYKIYRVTFDLFYAKRVVLLAIKGVELNGPLYKI